MSIYVISAVQMVFKDVFSILPVFSTCRRFVRLFVLKKIDTTNVSKCGRSNRQPKAKHLERQQQRLAERHNEHLARREDTKGSVQLTRFMTWPLGKELQPVMGSKYYLHVSRARIQEGMKDFERVFEKYWQYVWQKNDVSTLAGANKTEGRSPQELTETSGKVTASKGLETLSCGCLVYNPPKLAFRYGFKFKMNHLDSFF